MIFLFIVFTFKIHSSVFFKSIIEKSAFLIEKFLSKFAVSPTVKIQLYILYAFLFFRNIILTYLNIL
ncbi:MAG: hypothetical protein A2275_19205 [Bacteroidetes bacterium RIFOXYA12_FULL_35_11]|nr:MAG: hypothetical protein A2X01_10105 [Bacteroidetes bacterium GWF2_35_48]OFY72759.1 MAG: hypothetical protein A2275_19205 [Bacteroidetes bacterium RIFOXYA12_FULL_35_11]OFY97223.1 MAG: hypothetical protein A2309_11960 [Bacteroidetes bacterium RIFOXYB2_FULL_35_7]OFY97997.1 MAG: hypothetical protein A2491_19130 [Bacteroidetes bacterium RIFOXYC12_FULL_35_7]HBX50000.1 hypothetical protein [Bacteroidales bacterium]